MNIQGMIFLNTASKITICLLSKAGVRDGYRLVCLIWATFERKKLCLRKEECS